MRLISMTTRDELVVALAGRYALGNRADRGRMLDEFAALTGHHRKHAMRLLRAGKPGERSSRPERRIYDQATREALIMVWGRRTALVHFAHRGEMTLVDNT